MAEHQSGRGFNVARGVKRSKHLCANEYGNRIEKNGETPSLIGLPEATYYDYIGQPSGIHLIDHLHGSISVLDMRLLKDDA